MWGGGWGARAAGRGGGLGAGGVVGGGAAAAAILFQAVFEPDDMAPFDAVTRAWTGKAEQSVEFTVVDLGAGVRSRATIAAAVERIAAAKPRAIGIDVLLDEPRDDAGDAALERAIARAAPVPVVVAAEEVPAGRGEPAGLAKPLARFAEKGAVPGVANVLHDARGAVRGAVAWAQDGDRRVFGFAALLAGALRDGGVRVAEDGESLVVGAGAGAREIAVRRSLPTSGLEGAGYAIDFVAGDAVRVVPHGVLESLGADADTGRAALAALVTGRAVLIGEADLRRNGDMKSVPALSEGFTPGILVQAQALRTLLDGAPPSLPRPFPRILWTLAAAVATTALCLRARRPKRALLALGAVEASVAVVALSLFLGAGVVVPLANAWGAPVAAFAIDLWRRARGGRAATGAYLRARAAPAAAVPVSDAAVPYPIAAVRASAAAFKPGRERVERLVDAAEAGAKLLAAVAVADALRGGAGSSSLRARVAKALPKPSLGTFVALFREAAREVADREPDDDAFAPEIGALAGDPEVERILERFAALRNETRGHGAFALLPLDECRTMEAALQADLDALCSRLRFLAEAPLVRFDGTHRTPEGLVADVQLLMGPGESHPHAELPVREDAPRGDVVLVSRATGAVLSLSPFLASVPCRKHDREEVACINGTSSAMNPQYLSYVTGCNPKRLSPTPATVAAAHALLSPSAAAKVALAAVLLFLPSCSGDAPPAPPPAGPAAIVLSTKGVVEVERAGQGKRAVLALETLLEGDVLVPAAGAEALLLGRDDRTRTVRERAAIGAPPPAASSGEALFAALLSKATRMADPARLGPAAATRGENAPAPLFPRSRLLDGTPRFSWKGTTPGARYRVRVARKEDGTRTEVLAAEAEGDHLDWPAGKDALAPGGYVFTVEALAEEGTKEAEADAARRRSEETPFRVLGAAEAAAIGFRRELFEKAMPPALRARDRHVLLASFYEQDGVYLLGHAREEWLAAKEASSDGQDESVARMLADLERRMGLPLP